MANKKTHFTVLLAFPKVFEYGLIYFREVRLLTTVDIGNIPATNCRYNPKNEISRNELRIHRCYVQAQKTHNLKKLTHEKNLNF